MTLCENDLTYLVLTDWLALSPSLRIPKRKDGKEGSGSSSSSSSSDDEGLNLHGKVDLEGKNIPKPIKGECQICNKVFGMFKRSVSPG